MLILLRIQHLEHRKIINPKKVGHRIHALKLAIKVE